MSNLFDDSSDDERDVTAVPSSSAFASPAPADPLIAPAAPAAVDDEAPAAVYSAAPAVLSTADQRKLDGVRRLLAQPLSAELKHVFADLVTILGPQLNLFEHASQLCGEVNKSRFAPITIQKDQIMLVSSLNEIDNEHFVDHRSNQVYSVNHLNQEVIDSRPATSSETLHGRSRELFDAMDKIVQDLAANHYPSAGSGVFVSNADPSTIHLVVSARILNDKNMWCGEWRSIYKLNIHGSDATLSGTIDFRVHYYEDGNLQSSNSFALSDTHLSFTDISVLARAVSKTIIDFETKYHTNMESSLTELSSTALKNLRRPLPITKVLFDFGSYSHKLATELRRK